MANTLKWTARTVWGSLLCTGLAVICTYLFSHRRISIFLPFVFVFIIVAIAARYGVAVGILGTIVSAVIFAHSLFAPFDSIGVSDPAARTSLAWMVLGGIAIPYLVLPGMSSRSQKK